MAIGYELQRKDEGQDAHAVGTIDAESSEAAARQAHTLAADLGWTRWELVRKFDGQTVAYSSIEEGFVQVVREP